MANKEQNKTKKVCSIIAIFVLVFNICLSGSSVFASSFYDVPDDFWAAPYIDNLLGRGIVSGYGDGTFRPNDYVQRSEYAKMLVNSSGLALSTKRTSPFADVNVNEWYFPYVNSLTDLNAMTGFQSTTAGDTRIYFKPDDYASREDVTVALIKAMRYDLSEYYPIDDYLLSDVFYDYQSIPKQDRPYIAEAVKQGYITGTQNGTFESADPITRCEVSAVLCRAFPEANTGLLDLNKFNDNYDTGVYDSNWDNTAIIEDNTDNNDISEMPSVNTLGISDMNVFFLDVGQGDSEYIELPNGKTMLIDAGTADYGQFVSDFITSRGCETIDYVIATHPHADHIGGMKTVLDNHNVGEIFMPNADSNTKTYENFLTKIVEAQIPVTEAKAGVTLFNEDNLSGVMLAPNGETYKDVNSFSAVIKLTYGSTSFLFTGDAESDSEDEMLSNYTGDQLRANVIKIAHHGSSSSSQEKFLQTVSPQYAVISVGVGNKYGHPTENTLNTLNGLGITTYRTDYDGTICFESNGYTVTKID